MEVSEEENRSLHKYKAKRTYTNIKQKSGSPFNTAKKHIRLGHASTVDHSV